jgi:hypothetical protein
MVPVDTDGLRAALDASRAALLEAIQGLTDRDFAVELADGETVIGALAALAAGERVTVRAAREAAGAAPRPLPTTGGPRLTRAIPPQVVHDLAGARHETLLFLQEHAADADDSIAASLAAIAEREHSAAERIAQRSSGSAQ